MTNHCSGHRTETWKPFRSGVYEVSDCGRVRRARMGVRKNTFVGRLLKLQFDLDGYRIIHLHSEGATMYRVHQMVAEVFVGARPSAQHEVNHKNGRKADNHPANLEWVTQAENRAHETANRLDLRGVDHPRAKLTEEQVREIRASHSSQTSLARSYGVSQSLVWAIRNRKVWQHV